MAAPDINLALAERIRLDFTVYKEGASSGYSVDQLERFLWLSVARTPIYDKPVNLIRSDVHMYPIFSKSSITQIQVGQVAMGHGSMFFRDLSFTDNVDGEDWETKLQRSRQFLLEKLTPLRVRQSNTGVIYEFWAYVPVCDDAKRMMALIGSTQEPPTIFLKGVPCEWFACSPEIPEILRSFFKTIVTFRDLNVRENNVWIQFEDYEECGKALNRLCSFSLQKDSRIADYEVAWKDSLASINPEVHVDKRPRYNSVESSSKPRQIVSGNQDSEVQDLQGFKLLEYQLKALKAKLDESA